MFWKMGEKTGRGLVKVGCGVGRQDSVSCSIPTAAFTCHRLNWWVQGRRRVSRSWARFLLTLFRIHYFIDGLLIYVS